MAEVIDLDERRPVDPDASIDHPDLTTAELALSVSVNAILQCPETFGNMALRKRKTCSYKATGRPSVVLGGLQEVEMGDGTILEVSVKVKED